MNTKEKAPKVLKTVKVRFDKGVVSEQIRAFEKANPGIPFGAWVRGLVESVLGQMGKHEEFKVEYWQVFITSPALIQKAMADEAKKISIPDQRLSVIQGGKMRQISPDAEGEPGKRSVVGKRTLKLVKDDGETEVLGPGTGEAGSTQPGDAGKQDEGEQAAGEADRQG